MSRVLCSLQSKIAEQLMRLIFAFILALVAVMSAGLPIVALAEVPGQCWGLARDTPTAVIPDLKAATVVGSSPAFLLQFFDQNCLSTAMGCRSPIDPLKPGDRVVVTGNCARSSLLSVFISFSLRFALHMQRMPIGEMRGCKRKALFWLREELFAEKRGK